MTTTPALKRRSNRSTSCGVSAISGTSTSTWPPRANARAMTCRYTSVLPLPVTPCKRCAANPPSEATIASIDPRLRLGGLETARVDLDGRGLDRAALAGRSSPRARSARSAGLKFASSSLARARAPPAARAGPAAAARAPSPEERRAPGALPRSTPTPRPRSPPPGPARIPAGNAAAMTSPSGWW